MLCPSWGSAACEAYSPVARCGSGHDRVSSRTRACILEGAPEICPFLLVPSTQVSVCYYEFTFHDGKFGLPFRVCFSYVFVSALDNLGISFVSSSNFALIDFVNQFVELVFACCPGCEWLCTFLRGWRNSYIGQNLCHIFHCRASSGTCAACQP